MRKIYSKFNLLLSILCLGILGQGCNIINPHENTPTYIHIDSFTYKKNPLFSNLTSSHQISAVWVYYNNTNIGSFDLPATFPVIAKGVGTIALFPAILNDGRNDFVSTYPFYQPDTFSLTAQPGKIITHNPVTQYYDDIKDTIISNFQFGTGFGLVPGAGNRTMFVTTADSQTFEGPTGCILLSAVGDSSVDSSKITFYVPPTQSSGYIEFDYNTTVPFYVGLQANLSNYVSSSPNYLAGVSPNGKWQKFYLYLSEFAQQAQGTSYNFYIKAVLGPNQTSGRLLIDNIQLIHF